MFPHRLSKIVHPVDVASVVRRLAPAYLVMQTEPRISAMAECGVFDWYPINCSTVAVELNTTAVRWAFGKSVDYDLNCTVIKGGAQIIRSALKTFLQMGVQGLRKIFVDIL